MLEDYTDEMLNDDSDYDTRFKRAMAESLAKVANGADARSVAGTASIVFEVDTVDLIEAVLRKGK